MERTFPEVSLFHDSKGWKIVIETSGKMTKENIQYIEQIVRSLEEQDVETLLAISEADGD
jgi:hypothetical protein